MIRAVPEMVVGTIEKSEVTLAEINSQKISDNGMKNRC